MDCSSTEIRTAGSSPSRYTEMILPITKAQQHSIKTMQRKKKLQKNRDDSKGKS